jgi:hypothetical protein
MAKAKGKASKKKKEKKNIQNGVAHIQSTFNNTIITITDIVKVSRAHVRAHLLLPSLQRMMQRRRLKSMGCRISKFT